MESLLFPIIFSFIKWVPPPPPQPAADTVPLVAHHSDRVEGSSAFKFSVLSLVIIITFAVCFVLEELL